jgi:GAF domain-containing protein
VPAAPLPADESSRLQALRELLILDTPAEERFDRIVRFAAQELDVPIALISLVDAERQWFKARVGLDACSTPRDAAFCAYAILRPEVLVVPDATRDPRFADNPLVTGPPGIRFYVGAPLQLPGGARIGTLCAIDTAPRVADELDVSVMRTLSRLAVEEFERRMEPA